MTRDVALRIDALVIGVRSSLSSVADYMQRNVSEEEYKTLVAFVGKSMGETVWLSNRLYEMFPDIVPDELKGSDKE